MEKRGEGGGELEDKASKARQNFSRSLPDAACLPVPQVKLHHCVEVHNLQEGGGGRGEFQKRAKTLQTLPISPPISNH